MHPDYFGESMHRHGRIRLHPPVTCSYGVARRLQQFFGVSNSAMMP